MRGIGNDSVAGDRGSPASMVARYEALIRVSEALRAYHDRDTLFRSLARELRPVVQFSFLGLALYDEQTHSLDLRVLEATGNPLPAPELSPRSHSATGSFSIRHRSHSYRRRRSQISEGDGVLPVPGGRDRRVRCR